MSPGPVDAAALQTSSIAMVVQVNGKLRAHITVPVGADEGTVRAAALARSPCAKVHRNVCGA